MRKTPTQAPELKIPENELIKSKIAVKSNIYSVKNGVFLLGYAANSC